MAAALTSETVADLRALFDLFDYDGDGLLEVEEVGAVLANCGTVLTEAEVLDLGELPLEKDLRAGGIKQLPR